MRPALFVEQYCYNVYTEWVCKKWCSATRRRDNDRGPGREKSSIDNVVLEKKWVHYKAKQFYVLAMLLKRIDLQADSLFIFWPTVGMLESNRILWGRGSKSLSFCSQIMSCAREELKIMSSGRDEQKRDQLCLKIIILSQSTLLEHLPDRLKQSASSSSLWNWPPHFSIVSSVT